jgi:hypothetical protein
MSDCAHRLAASNAIRKLRDRSRVECLVKQRAPEPQEEPPNNPLIRLACAAIQLYARGTMVKGLDWEPGKSPLTLANACLATVRKRMESQND